MKGIHAALGLLGCVAASVSGAMPSAQAQTLNAEAVRAAKCTGAIGGNALLDYLDDEDDARFVERVKPANYVFLDTLRRQGLATPEAASLYDGISGEVASAYVTAAEEETWVAEDWEYLISCYEYVIQQMPTNTDSRLDAAAGAATRTYLENVKIMLQ